MADESIYERRHRSRTEKVYGVCLGQVTKVYAAERLCEVRTFGGTGALGALQIKKCQWLSWDSNPKGDESTNIPRRGSMCLVIFVDGEPYIIGYLRALNGALGAVTGKEQPAVEGDKILSNTGGNRIRLAASGLIELVSKATLRILLFPTNSLLNILCRHFEIRADGGTIDWKSDDTENTLWEAKYRRDLLNTFVVEEQKGAVDETTMLRTAVQTGTGGLTVYEETIALTGEVTRTVGPPGIVAHTFTQDATGAFSVETETYKAAVEATGAFTIENGAGSGLSLSVDPVGAISLTNGAGSGLSLDVDATGAIDLSNGAGNGFTAAIAATGDTDLTFGPTVTASISSSGEISLETTAFQLSVSSSGNLTITAQGKVDLTATQGLTTTVQQGDCQIICLGGKALISSTNIALDGAGGNGAGATGKILLNPTTIDPFTGTPLGPGSATVTCSP